MAPLPLSTETLACAARHEVVPAAVLDGDAVPVVGVEGEPVEADVVEEGELDVVAVVVTVCVEGAGVGAVLHPVRRTRAVTPAGTNQRLSIRAR